MTALFDQIVEAVIPMLEPGPKRSAIARRAAYAALQRLGNADDADIEPVIDTTTTTPTAFKTSVTDILL